MSDIGVSSPASQPGTFPDWRRVVPKPSENTAECDRKDLLAAIDRLGVIAAGLKQPAVALRWDGDGNEVEISLGDLGVDLVEATTTGKARVGASISYLTALLSAVDAERIIIDSPGPAEPIKISAVADPDLLVVLMPCRLSEVPS